MALQSRREFGDTQQPGARILDNAEGVLMGLRRCDADAAFNEILCAATQHGVPVFALAEALVTLTGGVALPDSRSCAAITAAQREWGVLLAPVPRGLHQDDGAADRSSTSRVQ